MTSFRRRPYRVECTGSLLTSEVKRHRARSVLGWGTAWEDLRVLSAFPPPLLNALQFRANKAIRKQHGNTVAPPARRVRKKQVHFSICACHPCAGAMLIFSVSFQF